MRKILITGSAGFIGSQAALKYAQSGVEVVGLDAIVDSDQVFMQHMRLRDAGFEPAGLMENKIQISSKYPNYRFVRMDLCNREGPGELLQQERFDTIIHLAARTGIRQSIHNPIEYLESNISGFVNLLEEARLNRISHFIYSSSSSVYGLNSKIPGSTGDRTDRPASIYAASKKADELFAHTYSHLYGLPTTGLRFFTVYGPWGRPDMAIFKFTKAILSGEPIDVYNFGKLSRDFTYIDDIVRALSLVTERSPHSSNYAIYNLGCDKPVSVMKLISVIEDEVGSKAVINMMPHQPGDVESTWADMTDFYREFGYKPQISIGEGIKKFVRWYRDYFIANAG